MAFLTPRQVVSALEIKPGEKVADFGASAGHIARELAREVGLDGEVYLIDIQTQLLTKVKHIAKPEELKVMRFLTGSVEEMGGSHLRDDSMDAVVLVNLLFELTEKEQCLKEALRVLKPAGRLLLIDWSGSFSGIGPQEEFVFSAGKARALAEGAGFVFMREVPASDYHYGLLFVKKTATAGTPEHS